MPDPMENGLFGMPDYEQIEDEMFPPLPPPHSPGHGGGDGADPFGEEGEVSKLADVPPAKRKGVKRPQPKLDSQRLISERGLPALRTLFDNVKFKGKGYEAEDLRLLMQKMENWAHRLYPKLQFEDFIDKIEKLGAKKEVQTCLKRIRLDMPLTHEDFMGRDDVEETPLGQQVFGEPDPDPFGSLAAHQSSEWPVHSTPAPALAPTPAPTPTPDPAPSLTDEQQRRIELNKQLALERRLARMQQLQQSGPPASQLMSPSLPADEPSLSSAPHVSQEEEQQEVQDMDHDQSSTSDQPKNMSQKDSPQCEKGDCGLTMVPQVSSSCEEDGD